MVWWLKKKKKKKEKRKSKKQPTNQQEKPSGSSVAKNKEVYFWLPSCTIHISQGHYSTRHSRTQATARNFSGHPRKSAAAKFAWPEIPYVKSSHVSLAKTSHMAPATTPVQEVHLCDQKVQSRTYGLRNNIHD